MSTSDEKFEQALKKAYQLGKKQNTLTKQQLKQFAQTNKAPQKKELNLWFKAQWSLACAGLFILAALWLLPEQSSAPLYSLDLNQYDTLEQHTLEQGEYTRTVKRTKAPSFKQHNQLISQARSFHGRVIEINDQHWLVADCQKKTLIEIEQDLMRQINGVNSSEAPTKGTLLALNSNQQGQFINIVSLPSQPKLLTCP